MRNGLIACCLLLMASAGAADLKPWFGEDLWLEWRATDRVVAFDRLHTDHGWEDYPTSQNYPVLSASFAGDDFLSAELELGLAHRDHSSNWVDFDHTALTLRYWAMSDIVGDPVALTVGITGVVVHKTSIRDLVTPHHGDVNGELHIAVGKEFACGPCWVQRAWAVTGLGIGNRGEAWVRAEAGYEKRAFCGWFGLHAKGLGGLGSEFLDSSPTFGGYGRVMHRRLDLGVEYTRDLCLCGEVTVGYYNRVWARNTPRDQHTVLVSMLWRTSLL